VAILFGVTFLDVMINFIGVEWSSMGSTVSPEMLVWLHPFPLEYSTIFSPRLNMCIFANIWYVSVFVQKTPSMLTLASIYIDTCVCTHTMIIYTWVTCTGRKAECLQWQWMEKLLETLAACGWNHHYDSWSSHDPWAFNANTTLRTSDFWNVWPELA
jgi:hypothetical protein